ncbi:hypothetical protein OF820_13015 [Oceanotoga sp. DSM 15011]|uniref:Cytosine/adenosine deaminase-related metal-dependent hydrolase n=1 Tax=Oceanotoga teriensis TaxID=515440 RepID=A0AA45C8R8_9BACT|nr:MULTISPECIES: hypothetical protein [Oceanotoga]MDO7975542.1 hypothetical protein [Oceanotoga teriensis]PWJ96170.1 cytosine/adenosine deaminase-related metal-dependent hydrolase [Oceanotoga teriensis]UYO99953.1 hypothetical protein OF820_13015 [Oceanotoga sp. DSM 15011]
MILKNCTILTGNIGEVIENGAIFIKDGRIVDFGNAQDIIDKYVEVEDDIKDMEGKIVLPGLSNPYTSFYINELSLINKSKNSDLPPYEKFSKIVGYAQNLVEDKNLFEDIVKLGAYKSLINGITTSIISIPYSEKISRVKEIGDQIGVKIKPSPIFLTENGIPRQVREKLLKDKDISSITILGVWGLESEDYEFLKEFIKMGKRLRIAIVDFQQEERYCMLKHGKQLVSVMKEQNILSKKVDIIFAGNITNQIMDFFASKGVRLIKSVRTELMEINYTPNLLDMLGRGMKVSIGTGIIDYSLFNEAKTLLITEKFHNKAKQRILYSEVERTIFMNNYSFVSDEFSMQMGKVSSGQEADLTILNCRSGEFLFNTKTPFTELSFRLGTEIEVWGAIVGGNITLWDRKVKFADIDDIKNIQKRINNKIKYLDI